MASSTRSKGPASSTPDKGSSSQDVNTTSPTKYQQIALRGFSPKQSAVLDARFNNINSTNASLATALVNLTRQIQYLNN